MIVTLDLIREYGPFVPPSAVPAPLPERRAPEPKILGALERAKEIIAEEAARCGLTAEDLAADTRLRDCVAARDMAIYRVRKETGLSLPKIGAFFNRDHTTVLHALRKVDARGGARLPPVPLKARPEPKPKMAPTFDHAEAMAMLGEGRTLEEVGQHFGVSRQRVRQIAKRHGVRSVRCRANLSERDEVIENMILSGASDAEISSAYGLTVSRVLQIRRSLGFRPFKTDERARAMAPYVEMVRQGRSITSVEREFGLGVHKLAAACKNAGVRSRAHSRHSDLSHRIPIIRELLRAGATWATITNALAHKEGRRPSVGSVYGWAHRNLPELLNQQARAA